MITPEVVGRIDPVCLAEPKDEREAGIGVQGLMVMLIAVTLGDLRAAASRLSAPR
jgi:hypothetical protein